MQKCLKVVDPDGFDYNLFAVYGLNPRADFPYSKNPYSEVVDVVGLLDSFLDDICDTDKNWFGTLFIDLPQNELNDLMTHLPRYWDPNRNRPVFKFIVFLSDVAKSTSHNNFFLVNTSETFLSPTISRIFCPKFAISKMMGAENKQEQDILDSYPPSERVVLNRHRSLIITNHSVAPDPILAPLLLPNPTAFR